MVSGIYHSVLLEFQQDITPENVEEKLSCLAKILYETTEELTQENIADAVDTLASAANISEISIEVGAIFYNLTNTMS